MKKAMYLLFMVVLCSCVHEFPNMATPADVVLNIHKDFSFDGRKYLNIPSEDVDAVIEENVLLPQNTLTSDEYDVRNIIRFYRKDAKGEYNYSRYDYEFVVIEDEPTLSNISTEVKIAEGTYMIYVWSDFVKEGESESPYYNTEDFRAISYNEEYAANHESKDAFYGSTEVKVIRYGKDYNENQFHISMERPFSKFVIISNHLEEFVTKAYALKYSEMFQDADDADAPASELNVDPSDYEVRLVYMSDGLSDKFGTDKPAIYDLPVTFNIFKEAATASRSNIGFKSSIVQLSDDEAQLGFDYIYPGQGMAYVAIGVYDKKDGTRLVQTPSIAIPLIRNWETVVTGSFLTENSNKGTVINAGFLGDHNYEIK